MKILKGNLAILYRGSTVSNNTLQKSERPTIEKSHSSGLVPRKVTITMNDGSTHQAIRWVNPDSNLPNSAGHSKYMNHTIPDSVDSFIEGSVNSDETNANDKIRRLVASGVYDKNTLAKLSGHKYPSDIPAFVKKETNIDTKEFSDFNVDETGRVYKSLPTTRSSDYSSKEVVDKLLNQETGVLRTIHELQEDDEASAFENQKEAAKKLLAELGIDEPTVDDKWDNYELSLRSFIKRGLGSKSLLAYGTGGIGKFQSVDSKVLTPYGFKRMGDLKKGDMVWCPDGTESKILEVFPQGIQPMYKVTLKDGRSTTSGLPHLWKVKERNTYTWKVLQLKDILEVGLKQKKEEYQFGIPLLKVPFEHKSKNNTSIPIHPWVLGFLLGDGSLSQDWVGFSVGERDREFVLNKLSELIGEGFIIKKSSSLEECIDYSIIVNRSLEVLKNSRFRNNFSNCIKELGLRGTLSHNKFIPELYFNLGFENKLELVRGLMDSDGYVNTDGFCTYTSTSKQLAEDFLELVRGLGARFASIKESDNNVKDGYRVYYDVNFMMQNGVIPVSLPFKLERIQNKRYPIDSLSIKSVEYIGDMEGQCILIDHPEHLYVTDDYIVTHNTYTFNKVAEELSLKEYDIDYGVSDGDYDFVTVTGKIGSNELQRAMYNHSKKLLVFDDCDSMWEDPELINVLKGALDTSNPGKVQFKRPLPESSKGANDNVPSSFKFTGKMIFITNLTKKKLNKLGAAPIVESRALSMDLSMSPSQTMDRIEKILPGIKIKDGTGEVYQGLEMSDKQIAFDVFKFVGLRIGRIEQLNTRVFSHIVAKAVEQREDLGGHDRTKLIQFAAQFIGGL